EIDDRDHRHDRHKLNQRVARPKGRAAAGLRVGGGDQHGGSSSGARKPRRFIKASSERRRLYSRGPCESNAARMVEASWAARLITIAPLSGAGAVRVFPRRTACCRPREPYAKRPLDLASARTAGEKRAMLHINGLTYRLGER